jgi:hypothetical protein
MLENSLVMFRGSTIVTCTVGKTLHVRQPNWDDHKIRDYNSDYSEGTKAWQVVMRASYRIAGNFRWCKIFSHLLLVETTPTSIDCMYEITFSPIPRFLFSWHQPIHEKCERLQHGKIPRSTVYMECTGNYKWLIFKFVN